MASSFVLRATGRGSLFRNSVAGAVATAADFALVVSLVERLAISPPLATFLGCVVGGAVNFGVNRRWAFGSGLPYVRQVPRYAAVSALSAGLNAALVALLLVFWPGSYESVWAVARGLVFVAWNYPMHRYFVFPASPG